MVDQINRRPVLVMMRPEDTGVEEVDYSYEFCIARSVRNLYGWGHVKVQVGSTMTVGHLVETWPHAPAFLLAVVPEVVVTGRGGDVLWRTMSEMDADVVVPLCNEAAVQEQRAPIPAPYHDFDNLEELAMLFEEAWGDDSFSMDASGADLSIVLVSSRLMGCIPRSLACEDIPAWLVSDWGGEVVVAKGALVHRFGNYYGSVRDDLVRLIPKYASRVLDVGCARGATGRALRSYLGPNARLFGAELNPVMARSAEEVYDQVLVGDVGQMALPHDIDAVLLGDVLEHMRRPDLALRWVVSHLAPGGVVVGSVPNAGHWSVISSLLRGEFEYIPVGLNCISHVRCFTSKGLVRLLEESGLSVERLEREMPPPLPSGRLLVEMAQRLGIGDEEDLLTVEFRFVARRE